MKAVEPAEAGRPKRQGEMSVAELAASSGAKWELADAAKAIERAVAAVTGTIPTR